MMLATVTEHQYTAAEFAGMPEGWRRLLGLLLLLCLGLAVFWMYRREARVGASAALRAWLASIRVAALVLLAIVWLEPVIATYTTRTITARTIVLADVSASMRVLDADSGAGRTRNERVASLLHEDDHAWLRKLAEKNEVYLYAFGERVTRVRLPWEADENAAEPGSPPSELPSATESRTDLGRAFAQALGEVGEGPIAGVVVLTDGELNRGMSADDLAVYARRFKAPVYAVGVGSPIEPPNLRVAGFSAPATTARGDPFEVRIDLEALGIETPAEVEVSVRNARDSSERARVVAKRDLLFSQDEPRQTLRIKLSADEAGEFQYRVRLSKAEGEAVTSDNEREATVQVLDERLRVLLVAGRPSYEYRYVTRLLEREASIELSCWLQSADSLAARDGDRIITQLPRRPEEVFEYDAVLLIDPDPRNLDSAWALTVRRLVDEFGGGLLLQAGPHYTSRFLRDPRLEDLIKILPALPDPDADMRLSEQGSYRTRAHKFVIPDESAAHPLVRLHGEQAANARVWEGLPGVWWRLPVLREKALATVLMRQGGAADATRYGRPVLASVQPFGSGRVIFLAFDGTWRWRAAAEGHFNRFWIQLVRYLAQPRLEGVSKRGAIVLDRDAVRPGDLVGVEARVLDEHFVPWHEAEVEGFVEFPTGDRLALRLEAAPGRPGWFNGRFAVDWTGGAAVRVPLPTSGAADPGAEEFLVKHIHSRGSDVELRSLRLRSEPLIELSEQTGGTYSTLDEAADLADLIENASQVRTTRGVDDPLWDNVWVMSVVAILLGVEWALRRRNHLL